MRKEVNIGLIGLGKVGSGVVKLLRERKEILREKLGFPLNLVKICDIDTRKKEEVEREGILFTTQGEEILYAPEIHIVIELIGGIEPAKKYVMEAINQGKYVVTANKALLAECGEEIFSLSKAKGKEIFFEASVMSGVPLLRMIREGLVANRIDYILGIINGTTNYILTQMEEGLSYKKALSTAQRKGFAEPDPTLDVKGLDTAHKLIVLSYLVFGKSISMEDVLIEGIEGLTPQDLEYAKEFGYAVKLLALGKVESEELEVRVHPTLIPFPHPLSRVKGETNALYLKGDAVGDIFVAGKGAGRLPTASAVVADVVEAAKRVVEGKEKVVWSPPASNLRIKRKEDIRTNYFLRFMAVDKPGVLAKISGILAQHHISIASVIQKGRGKKIAVPIIMMTHEAKEKDMQKAKEEIDKLSVIKEKTLLLRVENRISP